MSRPLVGSAGSGNGGWAAIGVSGSDLVGDLAAEAWRLQPSFPFVPAAVDVLMDELENLVSACRGGSPSLCCSDPIQLSMSFSQSVHRAILNPTCPHAGPPHALPP